MESESLLTELERLSRELEIARRSLGDLAEGLADLYRSLPSPAGAGARTAGAAAAPSEPAAPVVTNVPRARLAEARAAAEDADARAVAADAASTARLAEARAAAEDADARAVATDAASTARLRKRAIQELPPVPTSGDEPSPDATDTAKVPRPPSCAASGAPADPPAEPPPDATATARVPRPVKTTLPGPHDPDGIATGRVPRPTGRTLTGTPDPDAAPAARAPRPPSVEAPRRSSERITLPFGQLTPPEASEPAGDLADAVRGLTEGDAEGAGDERPTGEFQRPQRDTLTYFFGADGPAPDEEIEVGPVGGAPPPPKSPKPSGS